MIWPRDDHAHPKQCTSAHQVICDVVLKVAQKHELQIAQVEHLGAVSDGELLSLALVLNDGQQICQYLAWMCLVVQRVDDGHRSTQCELAHVCGAGHSRSNDVHHAGETHCRVIYALLAAHGRVAQCIADDVPSELCHTRVETDLRAQTGIVEHEHQRSLMKVLSVLIWRPLHIERLVQNRSEGAHV